jgi:hypothetical protein
MGCMIIKAPTKEELTLKKEQIKDQIMCDNLTWQRRMELYTEVRLIIDQINHQ